MTRTNFGINRKAMESVSPSSPLRRPALICSLFALELLLVVLVFQVAASVECRLTAIETGCRALREALLRGICLAAALSLMAWMRPALRARALGEIGRAAGRGPAWPLLHALGVLAIFAPLLTVTPATIHADFARVFAGLLGGGLVAAVAGVLWLMPARAWSRCLSPDRGAIAVAAAVAVLIPDLATLMAPLWTLEPLAHGTFAAVAALLQVAGRGVSVDPETVTIGLDGFAVQVASQCSGIEGFALLTGFLAIYALLFRDVLRAGRFWLVVWPLGLALSWALNVVRIAALIVIGARVSPELAVNGFHSFAGWFYFTLLALGVIAAVQATPWLHRMPEAPASGGLRHDWTVARIVPFIVFMVSGIAVQMAFAAPALGYPLQAASMAAALWWLRPGFLALDWRFDPVALGAGLAVGGLWLVTAEPDGDIGLGALTGAALAAWVACRLIGTCLLVPVIEEAFFRGYVLARLDRGGPAARAGAVALSSGLFALLHGRPVAAGLAGVAFALVMLRRGRLGDAILAHAAANTLIAAAALAAGDWSLV